MRHNFHRFALAAGLALSLITFISPAFAEQTEYDHHHGTINGGQRDVRHNPGFGQDNRGIRRDDGQHQGRPVDIRREPNGDGRDRGINHDPYGRDHRPVGGFIPGHDRDHPYRGHYAPPHGYGESNFWVDARGFRHNEHFYCSPGWIPTAFFYYPVYGYWMDPATGLIVYSAPVGLAPYTVVVNEVVYEQVWDPILGQWVTVEKTVPYYYTATYYPAFRAYGYVNFGGVVIYVR